MRDSTEGGIVMYDSNIGWRNRSASGVLIESLYDDAGCVGLHYESRRLLRPPEPGEAA